LDRHRSFDIQPNSRAQHLVVLLGDSITAGVMSANFVDQLTVRMGHDGYQFINAGINGDAAYNLLQRLVPIIDAKPDAVAIMVGTNDLQAYLRGDASPLSRNV
jgi:lysophospholipase L1-like esterase